MKESIEIARVFPVSSATLYNAWLDSDLHTAMTGGVAHCSDQEGGQFSAWDGYITGTNIELTPNEEIVQSWRTTEFDPADEDSLLSIQFKDVTGGCELTLIHTDIPHGQTQYKEGWIKHYLEPMLAWCER